MGSLSFFFFMVASNLHINLFIKLSPLLVGMYCSDCLQQKRPNENPLLAHISRGRGPPHPYLCDVKSSFDLFIKPGLRRLAVVFWMWGGSFEITVSHRKTTSISFILHHDFNIRSKFIFSSVSKQQLLP